MLEAAIIITVNGTKRRMRQATVAEAINLTELFFQQDRNEILQDLKDANASPQERLDCLREHAQERGMATFLVKCAMRVDRAKSILQEVNPPSSEWVDECDPMLLCETAMRVLGHDFDVEEENENPQKEEETIP